MPIKAENPPEIESSEMALKIISQINYLLRPGDPSPHEQGGHRCWQKCFTLKLKTLQGALSADPDQRASTMMSAAAEAEWSWRYLIGFSSQDALYATFNRQLKVTGLSRGPKAAAAVQAARELTSLPSASDGVYNVRVLTIPGLLTEVFWLEPESGQGLDGLIVPFATSQDLRCGHAYTAAKFFTLAANLADLRMSSEPTQTKNQAPQDSQPEKEGSQANSAENILNLAKMQVAAEDNERLRAAARRIRAETLRETKQAKAASAQKESWQRAMGKNS